MQEDVPTIPVGVLDKLPGTPKKVLTEPTPMDTTPE